MFSRPLDLILKINKGASEIDIKGTVSAFLEKECDRCLEIFEKEFQADFELLLSTSVSGQQYDTGDVISITSDMSEIDIYPFVKEAIVLNLPMKVICKDDCKGLCEHCGTNLNKESCKCKENEIDPRWKILENFTED